MASYVCHESGTGVAIFFVITALRGFIEVWQFSYFNIFSGVEYAWHCRSLRHSTCFNCSNRHLQQTILYFIIKRAAIPVVSMIFYKHPLRLRIARQQSNPGHQTWQKQLRIRNEIRYAPGALVLAFAWIIVCLYLQAPGSHQRKAKAGSLLSLGSIMKYTKYNKTAYLISKTDARSLSLKSIFADDRTERHPRIREKDSWAAILRKMKRDRISPISVWLINLLNWDSTMSRF